MENEGAHDEEPDEEGAHGKGEPSLHHMRPQTPYAPSFEGHPMRVKIITLRAHMAAAGMPGPRARL